MPQRSVSLALAFLKTRPQAAAGVLEQYDSHNVAAFLTGIPFSHATPVIRHMLPTFTARVCTLLETERAAGLLMGLDANLIATVLRCLDNEQQQAVLDELPTKTRTVCSLLLSYADDTVGAWMTPHVVTVSDDSEVRHALRAIRNAESGVHTDYIFVVDRELALKGRIHYSSLLRADAEISIDVFLTDPPPALSGRTSIARAAGHDDWKSYDAMPVLNRKGQFIGALRHVELRKTLAGTVKKVERSPADDPFFGFCETYGQTLLALFHAAADMLDSGSAQMRNVR